MTDRGERRRRTERIVARRLQYAPKCYCKTPGKLRKRPPVCYCTICRLARKPARRGRK